MDNRKDRGTFSFLFTDIEKHTRLWQAHPQAMSRALADHDALLTAAVESHQGRVVKMTGDGLFAVFDSAADAVDAAVTAQRALANHTWGSTGRLNVRMAIHAGEAQVRDNDYFGTAVIRAARIMSLAAGGQILISSTAAGLAKDKLSGDIDLHDLGRHRLKDLQRPAHLYQVMGEALPHDFPALRTLDSVPNNLPLQLTSFVGRDREIMEIRELLAGAGVADRTRRLVTLLGPGGAGKTRLALHAASDLLEFYGDGVWLLELAAMSDGDQVPQALAALLKLGEPRGITLAELIANYLRARRILIVLDNCEHILDSCASLCDYLLRNCPELSILATSRQALGIHGETIYSVPALGLLDSETITAGALLRSDAGRLFADRAMAVNGRFAITEDNAEAVAEICRQLDGLPLAIELAAARTNFLSAQQIVERLDDRFRLLKGGSRTAEPRQQTLEALIAWSYELLSADEKGLLRLLSVFKGGWTLEAGESIGGSALDVLFLLPQLINRSLVVVEESADEQRYNLLESIRQYARKRLEEEGDLESALDDHLAYYELLAGRNRPRSADVVVDSSWFGRCRKEMENFRGALSWALAQHPAAALNLAGSLAWFWARHGYAKEGSEWLVKALRATAPPDALPGAVERQERARAVAVAELGLAQAAFNLGDSLEAQHAARRSVDSFRDAGNDSLYPFALDMLAFTASLNNDLDTTIQATQEAVAEAKAANDTAALSFAYGMQSILSASEKEGMDEAMELAQRGLELARKSESAWGQVIATYVFARILNLIGHADFDYRGLFEELIESFISLEDFYFENVARSELAHGERICGNRPEAEKLYRQTIIYWRNIGQKAAVAHQLECFAYLRQYDRDASTAVRLLAAARALRQEIGAAMVPVEREEYERYLSELKAELSEDQFAQYWQEGSGLSVDEAIELAVAQ